MKKERKEKKKKKSNVEGIGHGLSLQEAPSLVHTVRFCPVRGALWNGLSLALEEGLRVFPAFVTPPGWRGGSLPCSELD